MNWPRTNAAPKAFGVAFSRGKNLVKKTKLFRKAVQIKAAGILFLLFKIGTLLAQLGHDEPKENLRRKKAQL